jgi:DHA1 family multidrug resistance protein-like MFS transporter
MYGFNVGETAVVFTCIIVGCLIAMVIYFSYLHFYLIPDILTNGMRAQEHRLVPALFACVGPTVGLFVFGRWLLILSAYKMAWYGLLTMLVYRLDGRPFNPLDR